MARPITRSAWFGLAVTALMALTAIVPAHGPAHGQAALTEDEANAILRGLRPDEPVARAAIDLEISFGYDSAAIQPEAAARLDAVATLLALPDLAEMRFEIAGHTDAQGDDGYNLRLSQRRADAVLAYLVTNRALPAERFVAVGYGETALKDPANPNSGVNRRVELVNVTPPEAAEASGSEAAGPETPAPETPTPEAPPPPPPAFPPPEVPAPAPDQSVPDQSVPESETDEEEDDNIGGIRL